MCVCVLLQKMKALAANEVAALAAVASPEKVPRGVMPLYLCLRRTPSLRMT